MTQDGLPQGTNDENARPPVQLGYRRGKVSPQAPPASPLPETKWHIDDKSLALLIIVAGLVIAGVALVYLNAWLNRYFGF